MGNHTNLKASAARMRFSRLVKAIECGTPIERNDTLSQRGIEKITEASKKRKNAMVDSDDSESGKKALCDQVDDAPAEKSMTPSNKRSKNKIESDNLANLGMNSSGSIKSEPEFSSPKVGVQMLNFKATY